MDDKRCQSSADSSHNNASMGNHGKDHQYLRQISKFSHKISKPIIAKKPTMDPPPHGGLIANPPAPSHEAAPPQGLQHQPPVYNINKNDFRDVVQKLTGSPAHERISTPPPIQQPKPTSSRLQRIRPPPLAQISNRPHSLLNNAVHPNPTPAFAIPNNVNAFAAVNNFSGFGRPAATPLSPLPPFPTVHAAAESPVSAYMRYLHNSMPTADSNPKQFSPLAPRWNNFTPPQPEPQPTMIPSQSQLPTAPSPAGFGFLNSPRSPYPLLSPSLLFSPSSGQLGFPQFPLSPTVPLPSPRWRAL